MYNRVGKDNSLTAKVSGEIVGYVISQFMDPTALDLIFNERKMNLAAFFEKWRSVCWIESIAVDSKYSRQKIGKKLIAELMSPSEDTPHAFFSFVWEYKNGSPLAAIYESLDFELVQRIPNYWQADSLKKGYSCYYCGNHPCHCSALIYALK